MPGAGDLDRRITIERNSPTSNDFNESVPSFSTLATVWAKREDMSDGEMIEGGMLGAYIGSRFVIRASDTAIGVKPGDRIKYGWDVGASTATPLYWNIKANKETRHGRKRFREITAVADADVQFSEQMPDE